MREVKAKRKRWREEGDTKGAEFLGKHMIPVILGQKQRHHVIDHRHLALALHEGEEALKLAKGTASDYLPGWCGPVTDD